MSGFQGVSGVFWVVLRVLLTAAMGVLNYHQGVLCGC